MEVFKSWREDPIFLNAKEKYVLQSFTETGIAGCECEWNSSRYKTIRELETRDMLKFHYFAEGFVYFLITPKGREALQNKAA